MNDALDVRVQTGNLLHSVPVGYVLPVKDKLRMLQEYVKSSLLQSGIIIVVHDINPDNLLACRQ